MAPIAHFPGKITRSMARNSLSQHGTLFEQPAAVKPPCRTRTRKPCFRPGLGLQNSLSLADNTLPHGGSATPARIVSSAILRIFSVGRYGRFRPTGRGCLPARLPEEFFARGRRRRAARRTNRLALSRRRNGSVMGGCARAGRAPCTPGDLVRFSGTGIVCSDRRVEGLDFRL